MSFDRSLLPDPVTYFADQGLHLSPHGKWRTTACRIHGGSDSMRIHVASGAWICMNCGVSGRDVLSYQMQLHGQDFITAARELGAWLEDGKSGAWPKSPPPLPARAALQVIGAEVNLVAVAALNVAHGVNLHQSDRSRLVKAAARIARVVEIFA
ncbi:hypothetical protein PE066_04265 [Ramlibacter tataouinensis]|uniref:hypothetical protein n=1 Tax=Ramlibacter tataouinensis TaxID=94132 RepID=UPI0022F39C6A|nr:hypothetical protein [Ramlibacter tataouinensis]WBY02759.1 hypothetical protein PE066_04265 [Ramlibacter tataouinensis]